MGEDSLTHPSMDDYEVWCEYCGYLVQGENPALQGGRESDMVPTTRRRWLSETQTLTRRRDKRGITGSAVSPSVGRRGRRAALHPCLRCAGSPVKRCEPRRSERAARHDRLGENRVEKPRGDDSLADGSARDSASRRSRSRVETRPADTGRVSLETYSASGRGSSCVGKPRRLRRGGCHPGEYHPVESEIPGKEEMLCEEPQTGD